MTRRRPRARDEGGFALIAVLLVLALLGVIGTEFAYSMRLEANAVRAYKGTVIGGHLAEAAVEQAIREIVADWTTVGLECNGPETQLTFFDRDRNPLRRLPRKDVTLGSGRFSYRLLDESERLNVNTTAPATIDRLLQKLGVDKIARDTIVDSIQDWRDPNEEHRLNGAESEDTYLKLPVPYRSRNANLESINELFQIKGVTPAIFNGTDQAPGLRDFVTVKTPGQVNINTASDRVLSALGLADAQVGDIVLGRCQRPFIAGETARFPAVGLTTTTRTFRIEAEGEVDGQVRARLTAIVQKRGDGGNQGVVVTEWSGIR